MTIEPWQGKHRWCASRPEAYEADEQHWANTREQAIADARRYGVDGPLDVQEYVEVAPEGMIDNADNIIDRAQQDADNFDISSEDFPDVGPEAEAELDALLTAWARKHLAGECLDAVGMLERVPALADLAPPTPRNCGGYVLPPSAEAGVAVPEEKP